MPKSYLIDKDGVIVSGSRLIPGADAFIGRLNAKGCKFLILTNSSEHTPEEMERQFRELGVAIPRERFYTSALATAKFLASQQPRGSAFVVGEPALNQALEAVGYTLTQQQPDYVVLGGTRAYDYQRIAAAIRLIRSGARFIATHPDATGPSEEGLTPGCGALAALLERASGVKPYFIGKPNPLMVRTALRTLNEHSENTVMIGDRMDTDVVMGIETGMETILVLSGVTRREEVERMPYRPSQVVDSVAELER